MPAVDEKSRQEDCLLGVQEVGREGVRQKRQKVPALQTGLQNLPSVQRWSDRRLLMAKIQHQGCQDAEEIRETGPEMHPVRQR